MSNKTSMSLVVEHSFKKADQILADTFDYEDGVLQRKRAAIAMNLIAIAATDGLSLKHMWTNDMLDDGGKINILNGLKDRPTSDADDAVSELWPHMDDDHKKLHMENHPNSKYHVIEGHNERAAEQHEASEVEEANQHEEQHQQLRERHERRNRNKRKRDVERGSEPEGDDDWWNQMSMGEQRKYLRAHPKSKKARRWRIGVRNAVMKVAGPIHEEVRKMGHDYKNGMEGIRAMRSGRKMSDEQKEGLKKTTGRIAKLTLAALVGVAMFTPLGGMALEVGQKYFEGFSDRGVELATEHLPKPPVDIVGEADVNNAGSGPTTVGQVAQAGTNLHKHLKPSKRQAEKDDEMELDWLRRDFTEWLMETDTVKLAKEIKENKR
jgi:hypothetical protein